MKIQYLRKGYFIGIKSLTLIVFFTICFEVIAQNVVITDDDLYEADPSSMLDIKSLTKGLLIPRLTLTERDNINMPAIGLIIFQTDNTPGFYYYNGSVWNLIGEIPDEVDPIFKVSVANGITENDTANWNSKLNFESQNVGDVLSLDNDANGIQIKNIASPTDAKDAATKEYVDALEKKLKAIGLLPYEVGDSIIFIYNGEQVTYGTVEFNGLVWMDRNLGASRVATSFDDEQSYGDLFQWGRESDGHQIRNPLSSQTEGDMSLTTQPGHGFFITETSSPYDWADNSWITRWTDAGGNKTSDDACPIGWRIPTQAEWQLALDAFSTLDIVGAYASNLKLPVAGFRAGINGGLYNGGVSSAYWSSSPDITIYFTSSWSLSITGSSAQMWSLDRVWGCSVRCIRDY